MDSTVKEVEAIGRKSFGITCDVSDYDQVKDMIAQVVKKMGKIDVTVGLYFWSFCDAFNNSWFSQVANAGIAAVKEVRLQSAEELKKMMDVNVHGLMNTYIHSANAMIEAETKGRIIGAASIVAYK
jgi:NADP-dependent 3-hydroxy acid dehydrogenase YdfG